jgi:hypothetical protein
MALELSEYCLKGVEGKFYFDPSFVVEKSELTEFEKVLPFKEIHRTQNKFSN